MPITPVNKPKNAITPTGARKGGFAFWGDPVVTWGDTGYGWGSPFFTFINRIKNIITPSNKAKN